MAAAGRLRRRCARLRHRDADRAAGRHRLRPGEALALDRDDVDLRHGVVHVRAGKNNKQREVPLHAEHHQRAARLRPPA